MSRSSRRATKLAITAAGTILALLPLQANAATNAPRSASTAPKMIGTELNWASIIPSHVRRGQTITFSVWTTQNSPDRMNIYAYTSSIWNFRNPGLGQLKGLTYSMLDPFTHKWVKPTSTDPNGTIMFDLDGRTVPVASRGHAHVYMRITFGMTATLGTWHMDARAGGSTLVRPNGTIDTNYVRYPDDQYTLTLTR